MTNEMKALSQAEGYIETLKRDTRGAPLSCKGCRYRLRCGSVSVCNYLQDTGVPRGCSVKNCSKYKKGNRDKEREDWVSGYTISA